MESVLIVFGSITIANKAKKLAAKAFDYAAVVQLPPNLGIRGCSYCLRIRYTDYEAMLAIAEEHKLRIKAAFKETDTGGEKEYVKI